MPAVTIPTDEGFALEGLLEGPVGAPGVVVCHPHPAFGGTMHIKLVVHLARRLSAAGLRTLRFNFRGIGASGGTPTGGLAETADVRAACAFLRAHPGTAPGPLRAAGYSFGGLMTARALAAGEPLLRWAAIGLPTSIIGDDPDRIADLIAANRAAPALYVTGEDDRLSSIDRLRAWAEGIPGTRIDAIPNVGHFPEGPDLDEVLDRVVDFLR